MTYVCTNVTIDEVDGIEGFDWDRGNISKCRKHGVSVVEIESLFSGPVMVLPDDSHSLRERRFKAVGNTAAGRHIFLVFAVREKEGGRYLRPISARYMHAKEVKYYEKENPDV